MRQNYSKFGLYSRIVANQVESDNIVSGAISVGSGGIDMGGTTLVGGDLTEYTKTVIQNAVDGAQNTAISGKANAVDLSNLASSVYTKSYVDTLISGYTPTTNQTVIDNAQNTLISGKLDTSTFNTTISNYRTSSDQDTIDNAQNTSISGKLDTSTFNTTISNYRTSSAQDTIDNAQNTLISSKLDTSTFNTTISNYRTASAQDTIDNAQNTLISSKLDTSTFNTTIANYRTASAQDTIDNAQTANINLKANTSALASYQLISSMSAYRTASAQDTIDNAQNTNINSKAPQATTYTKAEVDALIVPVNLTNYYTKPEVDSKFQTGTSVDYNQKIVDSVTTDINSSISIKLNNGNILIVYIDGNGTSLKYRILSSDKLTTVVSETTLSTGTAYQGVVGAKNRANGRIMIVIAISSVGKAWISNDANANSWGSMVDLSTITSAYLYSSLFCMTSLNSGQWVIAYGLNGYDSHLNILDRPSMWISSDISATSWTKQTTFYTGNSQMNNTLQPEFINCKIRGNKAVYIHDAGLNPSYQSGVVAYEQDLISGLASPIHGWLPYASRKWEMGMRSDNVIYAFLVDSVNQNLCIRKYTDTTYQALANVSGASLSLSGMFKVVTVFDESDTFYLIIGTTTSMYRLNWNSTTESVILPAVLITTGVSSTGFNFDNVQQTGGKGGVVNLTYMKDGTIGRGDLYLYEYSANAVDTYLKVVDFNTTISSYSTTSAMNSAISTSQATQDAVIASNYVNKTSSDSISGVKTFSSGLSTDTINASLGGLSLQTAGFQVCKIMPNEVQFNRGSTNWDIASQSLTQSTLKVNGDSSLILCSSVGGNNATLRNLNFLGTGMIQKDSVDCLNIGYTGSSMLFHKSPVLNPSLKIFSLDTSLSLNVNGSDLLTINAGTSILNTQNLNLSRTAGTMIKQNGNDKINILPNSLDISNNTSINFINNSSQSITLSGNNAWTFIDANLNHRSNYAIDLNSSDVTRHKIKCGTLTVFDMGDYVTYGTLQRYADTDIRNGKSNNKTISNTIFGDTNNTYEQVSGDYYNQFTGTNRYYSRQSYSASSIYGTSRSDFYFHGYCFNKTGLNLSEKLIDGQDYSEYKCSFTFASTSSPFDKKFLLSNNGLTDYFIRDDVVAYVLIMESATGIVYRQQVSPTVLVNNDLINNAPPNNGIHIFKYSTTSPGSYTPNCNAFRIRMNGAGTVGVNILIEFSVQRTGCTQIVAPVFV